MCILPHTGSAGPTLPVVSGSPVAVALVSCYFGGRAFAFASPKGGLEGPQCLVFLPGTPSGFFV